MTPELNIATIALMSAKEYIPPASVEAKPEKQVPSNARNRTFFRPTLSAMTPNIHAPTASPTK